MQPEVMKSIIAWSIDAAREHVSLAIFNGETPDPETSMGLWQSFQAKFPKREVAGDYDGYVSLYSETYSNTVKALTAILSEKKA